VTGHEVVACEQVVAAPPGEVFRFLPRLAAVVAGQEPIPYPTAPPEPEEAPWQSTPGP
jgi:hypothetical protein